MVKKPWFGYISAYLFWAISLAVALWFLALARNTVPLLIANLLIQDPTHARTLQIIIDRVLILVGGIGWLAFMAIIEQYFRKGVIQECLCGRISRVFGILLVLIFLADSLQMLQTGIQSIFRSSPLVLLAELIFGVGLIYLSDRVTKPSRRTQTS